MRIGELESEQQTSQETGGDWIPFVDYFLLCSVVLAVMALGMGKLERKGEFGGSDTYGGTRERVYVTKDKKGYQFKTDLESDWRTVSRQKLERLANRAKKKGKRIVYQIPDRFMEVTTAIDQEQELILQGK